MERNKNLKQFSRQLRTSPTKEEFLLWNNFLRKYPLQFRRQYVIGNYIVDFYCHRVKLVVELDGSQHYDPDKTEQDRVRTEYLRSQGLQVLRFTNLEVLREFNAVCEAIHNFCEEALEKASG